MTKVKLLAFLVVVVLLAAVPTAVLAQQLPPHRFYGTATLDGAPAPDGTEVAAIVGGEEVATATVSDGSYLLNVRQPEGASFAGETVSFRVGTGAATETGTWEMGGLTQLNLTATSGTQPPAGVDVEEALAPLMDTLEIASSFNYDSGEYEAFVPDLPNNTLTEISPNSVIIITLTEDATVTVSGQSFPVMADVSTPLPVGAQVTITVQ